MSKPIFSDLYSISTRRNRQSYIFFTISVMLLNIVAVMILTGIFLPAFNSASEVHNLVIGLFWVCTVTVLIAYIWLAITALTVSLQRYNDLGWPRKWFVILWVGSYVAVDLTHTIFGVNVVPADMRITLFWPIFMVFGLFALSWLVMLIALIFFRGQEGENQYGLNPLDEFAVTEEKPKT